MDNELYEVVILRPTVVFLSFLISQLGEDKLASFKLIETDCTAYLIKKCATNEDSLNVLEPYYTKMFRHELVRWLGTEARNPIEKNALDFLCCFKLEFHSHLIVLESSIQHARQLIELRPKALALSWLNKNLKANTPELASLIEQVSLHHLVENSSVLLKNFGHLNEIKPFLERYYPLLFATLMTRFLPNSKQYPKLLSFKDFTDYFSVQIHTQLISYAA